MCGRFALFASGEEVPARFQFADAPRLDTRYNIAPTQTVAAVTATDTGRDFRFLRWGLIPSWATDPKIGYQLSNARAETVASKPSFRAAFKQRRCLVPVSAFYEWQQGADKRKQPYCIRMRDEGLFALAGLWEHWHDPSGPIVESCSLITTEANELMRPIHDRMPVILDPKREDEWLNPRSDPDSLRALIVPFASARMQAFPVNPYVSNAKNEGPRCIEPLDVA
jgi:putative SOS response-associated peptidase YedK